MGLDTVELVLAVEERFSIHIPNEVAARLETVGLMHQYVVDQLQQRDPPYLTSAEVLSILTDVICDQLGVTREVVVPGAYFVKDLRAD